MWGFPGVPVRRVVRLRVMLPKIAPRPGADTHTHEDAGSISAFRAWYRVRGLNTSVLRST